MTPVKKIDFYFTGFNGLTAPYHHLEMAREFHYLIGLASNTSTPSYMVHYFKLARHRYARSAMLYARAIAAERHLIHGGAK
jgi:hypothetical protein